MKLLIQADSEKFVRDGNLTNVISQLRREHLLSRIRGFCERASCLALLLLPMACASQTNRASIYDPRANQPPPIIKAQSPKGAATAAGIQMFIFPPFPDALITVTGNTNPFALQARNACGPTNWVTLATNCVGSVVVSNAALVRLFSNPVAYSQTLGWNPVTDPTVVGEYIYWSTVSGTWTNHYPAGGRVNVPDPAATNCTVTGLTAAATYYVATTYSVLAESALSNQVGGTPHASQAQVAVLFRAVQPSGKPATLTITIP